ncbi:hypothetical protein K435DRAFT_389655 [Dendrothele bispora CBS 962.96]|uniref:C2H2-type domain-containing protein n=1 Tax=Dendrothele bispora (strain CBS 962.96) TaxID=1314807 RepID=A0A4S8L9H0_DENBC|nr:hypothetical protein K435DRAFT_389655 [Dendrothele bispora CBS 962.96]
MARRSSGQYSFVRLVVFWVLCLSKFGVNALVNVTVDDSDSSILYNPSEFWFSNAQSCLFCLHPDVSLAYKQTYHYGSHVNSVDDDDASPSASSSSVSPPSSTSSPSSAPNPPAPTSTPATSPSTPTVAPSTPTASPSTPTASPSASSTPPATGEAEEDDDDDDDDDEDHDSGRNRGPGGGSNGEGGEGSSHRRRDKLGARIDSDDPGFIDSVVNVQFKFTGTDVYLYGIKPLFHSDSPHTPTAMNLSFTLDNNPSGQYVNDTSATDSKDFAPNVLVFSQRNLDDKPHVLLVTIQPETIFIFDYMVYTSTNEALASLTTDMPTPTATTVSSGPSKHNIATFAGAIGGSAGALGTLALCIFLSLCRRRRVAARRERRERLLQDPEHASSTSDNESSSARRGLLGLRLGSSRREQPQMIGPRPFVPRYFPGTVMPPSYGDSETPYHYADPEDIDASSLTNSVTTREGSVTAANASTVPVVTQSGVPVITIPSAPPPVYNPSPTASNTNSHSALPTTLSSTPLTSSTNPAAVPITYADIPPSVPPPTTDQLEVPPSFGEALASPPVSPITLLHENNEITGANSDTLNSVPGLPGVVEIAAQDDSVQNDPGEEERELPSSDAASDHSTSPSSSSSSPSSESSIRTETEPEPESPVAQATQTPTPTPGPQVDSGNSEQTR